MQRTKVLLGFSGGVDSSAAVILLKKAGYEVVGLCFNVTNDSFDPIIDETAQCLGIKLIKKSVKDEFYANVIKPFINDYENGRTPNPCIVCNPTIKFKVLYDTAIEEGCEYISTGHYAGVQKIADTYYIKKAVNLAKDQSYMLCRLPQIYLSKLILPLHGAIDKNDVRSLTKEYNLPNSSQKDSQDICFIPNGDYYQYLLSAGAANLQGNYVDKLGNIISPHKGILNYTIGQRKGLGIALGKPAYVTEIKGNDVVIGEEADLYSNKVKINNLFWAKARPKEFTQFTCKLRYSAKDAKCTLKYIDDETVLLEFEDAQRAPTPGQTAVLYHNNLVIGSGVIVK